MEAWHVNVLSTSHACVGGGEGRRECMLDDCCMHDGYGNGLCCQPSMCVCRPAGGMYSSDSPPMKTTSDSQLSCHPSPPMVSHTVYQHNTHMICLKLGSVEKRNHWLIVCCCLTDCLESFSVTLQCDPSFKPLTLALGKSFSVTLQCDPSFKPLTLALYCHHLSIRSDVVFVDSWSTDLLVY